MAELSAAEQDRLSDDQFAFAGQRKEPLVDAGHVRNAIARFDQVQNVSDAETRHRMGAHHRGRQEVRRTGIRAQLAGLTPRRRASWEFLRLGLRWRPCDAAPLSSSGRGKRRVISRVFDVRSLEGIDPNDRATTRLDRWRERPQFDRYLSERLCGPCVNPGEPPWTRPTVSADCRWTGLLPGG